MRGHVAKRGLTYTYYFKVKVAKGKYKQISKGGYSSIRDCEKALKKAMEEVEFYGYEKKEDKYTISEFIDYWIENVGQNNRSYNTVQSYRQVSKSFIVPKIGDLFLEQLTVIEAQKFFSGLKGEIGISTMRNVKAVLYNVFETAKTMRLVYDNVINHIQIASGDKNPAELISTEEVYQLIDKIKGSHYELPFRIGLYTGMRISEILGLQFEDVDFSRQLIKVTKQQLVVKKQVTLAPLKTQASKRVIPIPDDLKLALIKCHTENLKCQQDDPAYNPDNFICVKKDGTPIMRNTLSIYFKKISTALGINFTFHSLRHYHATLLLESGINVKAVADRLGHAKVDTTLNIYSHLTKKMQQEVFDVLNDMDLSPW